MLDPDPLHDEWMRLALDQAGEAAAVDEVPIGAVVVQVPHLVAELAQDPEATPVAPRVLAARHNQREGLADPTAHAELLALRDAATALGRWRLDDCLLVVTLEPCPMCAGAAWASRVAGVVSGAENPDAGALGSLYHLGQDPRLNHEFPVRVGVLGEQCAAVLREFFARRR